MDQFTKDTKPYPISEKDWAEIIKLPAIREAWGLSDESPSDFAASVYGVKFKFVSGSPGYVGDLFLLHGDALTGYPPLVWTRGDNGQLVALQWVQE